MMWMSVPQMPQAPTWTTTSSGPGSGTGTSTTRTVPGSSTMTAFITHPQCRLLAFDLWISASSVIADNGQNKRSGRSRLFHGAHRETAHQLPLRHPAQQDDREHR